MCLAIPAKIERRDGDQAVASVGGTRTEVNVALVPAAGVGAWVLIHAGYAIAAISEAEALETYSLLREVGGIVPDEGDAGARPE
jgi:hydrogenase expression/formation protein HypC